MYILTSFTFLVSEMGLTIALGQLVCILKAKLWKVVMKWNILFFQTFGLFFSKRGCDIFFLSAYPINLIFEWQYVSIRLIRLMFLIRHFFSW